MASNKTFSEPPLVKTERTETISETGEQISVTTIRRGILATETRTYKSFPDSANSNCRKSVKEQLENQCKTLRDRLEKWGLPSDRQRFWFKIGNGDYQPCADDFRFTIDSIPVSSLIWYTHLREQTEPLTQKRCVGDLLWALTELLKQPGIEPYLWHIAQYARASGMLKIAGAPNFFAAAGIAARKGRSVGPTAKQKQAAKRREAIWPEICEFWQTSPNHRNDAANTALALADKINQVLREQGLLPPAKKGLSVKTINDYIRVLIRGKSV